MRVVWSLVHTLQKTSKRMRRDLGVTAPQRLVIRVLGLSPRISAGALAKILHVHPSTLTGVLKRLEDQGALRRTVDPADARRHFLSLTARGRRVNAAQTGTVEAAVRRVLAGRPAVDREIVREVLSSVIHQLETAAAGSRKAAHRRRHRLA